jgi:hypothetical protein
VEGRRTVEQQKETFEVVRDALYSRNMNVRGCFVFNVSSGMLRDIGPPALPAIERVVLEEVMPSALSPQETLERRFTGLLNVLVSYFEITKGEAFERAIDFFRSLHGSVKILAMQAINNVYLLREPRTPVPEPLLEGIREIAEYGNGSVKDVASWFLDRAKSPG